MTLERMAPRHLPAVADLERRCFSLPWSLEGFAEELENPNAYYVVVEEEGRLLGYAGMRFVLDEFYVDNIAVAPECRRQGVGRALMGELIRRARGGGASFLSLEARLSNLPAQGLYRGLGFAPAGLRKNFYEQPREDGLIMTLFLKEQEKPI